MKKLIIIAFVCLLLSPFLALAKQWCCSWHKWVAYCAANGRYVCNDWTYSPTCTCWGSTNSKSYTYYSSNYTTNSYSNNYKTNNTTYVPTYNHSYCKSLYGDHAIMKSNYSCWCENWRYFLSNQWKYSCYDDTWVCKLFYGNNVYADKNWNCICNNGYIFDWEKCEIEIVVRANNCNKIANTEFDYSTMQCYCKYGYIYNWTSCILAY